MLMRSSTFVTPGAAHATCSASSRSTQDRTEPLSVTLPPLASTAMWLASITALRWKASSILRFTSAAATAGVIRRELLTPLNSFQPADSSCRPFLLEIPFNLAFERNPPVSDNRFYVLCAAGQLTLDRCDGIARDIGVRPLPTTNTCNDDVDRLFGRY